MNNLYKYILLFWLFSSICFAGLMSDHFSTTESDDDDTPFAYIVHTYGDATRTYQEGDLSTWKTLTNVSVGGGSSKILVSADSSGNTIYMTDTTLFDDCELNDSTIYVAGQTLTVTGVTANTSITVSDIDGTISSGAKMYFGYVLDVYADESSYNDHVAIYYSTGMNTTSDYFRMIRGVEDGVTFHCTDSLATYPYSVFQVNSEAYFTFKNLTVTATQNDTHAIRGIWVYGSSYAKILNCEIPGITNTGGEEWAIEISNGSLDVLVRNTLIRDCTQGVNCQGAEGYLYNLTIIDCDYAIERRTAGTITATNCIFYSSNTADVLGTSVTQTNCNTDESVTFKDYSGDDYHLDDTDTGAIGQGTQLYSDSDNPFFYDKDGVLRGAVWDIGCFENTKTSNATWYVRETGSIYGDADGTSYADAWAGTDNIDVDDLSSGDTLYICGDHYPFVLEDFLFDNLDIRGDYPADPCTISGLKTIASIDWTLVSGSLYKAEITDYEAYDYNQTTMPTSPTTGETWFVEGKTLDYRSKVGRAYIYDGTNWVDYQFFDRPQIVLVDDEITQPYVYGIYDYTSQTNTTVADTVNLTQADDYWNGALITRKPTSWTRDTRKIIDSDQASCLLTHYQIAPDQVLTYPYYIENVPPAMISSDYEWSFRVESGTGYLYMQLPSTSGQTVQYAGAGSGILLKNCSGLHLSGFTIEYCNDCGILAVDTPELQINNNIIQYCAPNTYSYYYGMVSSISTDIDTMTDTTRNDLKFFDCQNNTISYLQSGGSGIYNWRHGYATISNNTISNMRVFPHFKGRSRGIFCRTMREFEISNNEIYYTGYGSIGVYDSFYGDISDNICSHSLYDLGDGGAIYTNMNFDVYGDITIARNRIEHVQPVDGYETAGVYLDVYTRYVTVINNYFYDIASGVTGCIRGQDGLSRANVATDNYIYDADAPIIYDWFGSTESGNTRLSEGDYPFLNEPCIIWFLK